MEKNITQIIGQTINRGVDVLITRPHLPVRTRGAFHFVDRANLLYPFRIIFILHLTQCWNLLKKQLRVNPRNS